MKTNILGYHFDKDILLTFLLIVAIAIPTWANQRYAIYAADAPADSQRGGSVTPNDKFAAFIQAWDVGLPFFLVFYALYVKSRPAKEQSMYTWVVLAVCLGAWIMVLLRPIGGGTLTNPGNNAWDGVGKYVAQPLAAGALFALPITYL
jgi:hypothetical protein